jgi:xanthosine utilization system XapX-like protein
MPMPIFTIHVPDSAPDLLTRADRTVFVREGFSLRAFLFGLLFLLWHRLWIATAVWVTLLLALGAAWLALHPPAFVMVALVGLMHLYLGAESADLVRSAFERRGLPMRDLVSAASLGDAEVVYFGREPVAEAAPSRPLSRTSTPMPPMPAVIGFSDAGMP